MPSVAEKILEGLAAKPKPPAPERKYIPYAQIQEMERQRRILDSLRESCEQRLDALGDYPKILFDDINNKVFGGKGVIEKSSGIYKEWHDDPFEGKEEFWIQYGYAALSLRWNDGERSRIVSIIASTTDSRRPWVNVSSDSNDSGGFLLPYSNVIVVGEPWQFKPFIEEDLETTRSRIEPLLIKAFVE